MFTRCLVAASNAVDPSHCSSRAEITGFQLLNSLTKSELLYDWLFTASQFVLASNPLRLTTGVFFFLLWQLNRCGHWPCVTSSLTRGWARLLWIGFALLLSSVRIAHIACYWKLFLFIIYKSSVSTGVAKRFVPILRIICYNGSLVTRSVVSLPTAKFKPLIISMSGFTLSYTPNMFILMILYDFCLLPVQFYYIILYIRKLCANRWPVCTLENFQWCAEPCFLCTEIFIGRCLPLIPKRDKRKTLPIWSVLYGGLV
jgi:hypothetical protein